MEKEKLNNTINNLHHVQNMNNTTNSNLNVSYFTNKTSMINNENVNKNIEKF
jgi:hypothetical protein